MNTSIKTRKVRIKVLIGSNSKYVGHGWTDASDRDLNEVLYENGVGDINTKEYWIIAEIPIPGTGIEEIAGEIE